jgi:hypothetical protein
MGFLVKREALQEGHGERTTCTNWIWEFQVKMRVFFDAFLSLMQHSLLLLNSQTNGGIHSFATGSGGKFPSIVVNQTAP